MKKRPAPPTLSADVTLVDSHCHLDMDTYQDDLNKIIDSAGKCGISRIISIGIDVSSSRKAVKLAELYPGVYATIGIHPHSADEAGDAAYRDLEKLAAHAGVVGYGEIGLDYAKQYAPVDMQCRAFADQLDLAKDLHLPVVIHDREAHQDTMTLLRQKGPFPAGGVMHCFSGDVGLARKVLDLGFYISIPGIVTFKNSAKLQQVVKDIPLDRMLLETDGPFLAPVPWRGKTNRPEYLLYTAGKVAELKKISIDEVARQSVHNTDQLFFQRKNR